MSSAIRNLKFVHREHNYKIIELFKDHKYEKYRKLEENKVLNEITSNIVRDSRRNLKERK